MSTPLTQQLARENNLYTQIAELESKLASTEKKLGCLVDACYTDWDDELTDGVECRFCEAAGTHVDEVPHRKDCPLSDLDAYAGQYVKFDDLEAAKIKGSFQLQIENLEDQLMDSIPIVNVRELVKAATNYWKVPFEKDRLKTLQEALDALPEEVKT